MAVPQARAAADLAFISTATTFGTAVHITLSELSIEAFFRADEATSRFARSWAESP